MNPFLTLLFAIVSEIIATAALKSSQGLTRLAPSSLVVLGYGAAFYLLALSLKQIPLGTAYVIWSGVGTVGAVIVGALIWREALDIVRIGGIALIVIGVIVLHLFTKSHPV